METASRTQSASVFVTPARFATASSNSAFVMMVSCSFCLLHTRGPTHMRTLSAIQVKHLFTGWGSWLHLQSLLES